MESGEFKRRGIFILIAVFIFLVGASILIYFKSSFTTQPLSNKNKLAGEILMSLAPVDGSSALKSYVFNVEAQSLSLFPFSTLNNDTIFTLNNVISPSEKQVAYVAGTLGEVSTQIYVANIDGTNSRQVTHSSSHKQLPDWSSDGNLLVFMAIDADSEMFDTDSWEIFVTDLVGNEQFIGVGAHPKFSPDKRQILFMKTDGLYTYNLDTYMGSQVWQLNRGITYTGMKIELSKDGTMLAWSIPDDNKIQIAEILSLDPFVGKFVKTIEKRAFWTVFSPDGKFLAIQEVDDNYLNPSLSIYALESMDNILEFDLSDYYQEAMWFDDWK